MSSTPDHADPSMSLDAAFTPPTREQWIEATVAGRRSDVSNTEALQQLRRNTLEGIPLEVLYDNSPVTNSIHLPQRGNSWDNRLSVSVEESRSARDKINDGLQGGISSIELHAQTSADISTSLANVDLNIAAISLRPRKHYKACADALLQLAAAQNIDNNDLRCCFNADPVGVSLIEGNATDSMLSQLPSMAAFAKTNAQTAPKTTSVMVDTAVHHNAGASTVEELHAALATAALYLEAMLVAGMDIGAASQQLVFQIALDADVLVGVAKLRALHILWRHLIIQMDKQATNIEPARIVVETSGRYVSLLEPWNNHLRNLAAGTAALLGEADTLLVHPHNELDSAKSISDTMLGERMARNVAIILERECGLRKVQDPMAGSYAIENLTQQLVDRTWQSLASTDTGEGWLDELQSGRWQSRLAHTHQQRIALMSEEKRIAIGVNRFVQADATELQSASGSQTVTNPMLKRVRDAETFEQKASQEVSS